ncbi:MAG: HAD-IIA family hydrolase [Prevotellaceae bacterium]|jgi:NagD protein|nr:HAD-IIA family hydrolase [Prevotellaceae bacterium]
MTEKYRTTFSKDELFEKVRKIKHIALDMDGTIYMGMSLFSWTKKFLSDLNEIGIEYSFLTNNPSKNVNDYLQKLKTLGIDTTRNKIYTTALTTIDYLKSHYPSAKRLFMLGTPSMIAEFEAAGFESTTDNATDAPDALIVAFDMTLEYSRLCRAAWWASQNIPYIATNPDKVCPTDKPVVLVDCGSICKCIEHATNRKPDIVLGKPDPNMLAGIKQRYNLQSDEIAMIGDRIYTDIAMAHNAGAMGILVLSGETTDEIALSANPQPHITVLSLKEFGEILFEAQNR